VASPRPDGRSGRLPGCRRHGPHDRTTGNDIEVRIDLAAGWTKLEIEEALERIVRFILDPGNSTTIAL
jgi:hypothetical protein